MPSYYYYLDRVESTLMWRIRRVGVGPNAGDGRKRHRVGDAHWTIVHLTTPSRHVSMRLCIKHVIRSVLFCIRIFNSEEF